MPKPKDPWDNIFKRNVIRKEAVKRNPYYRKEYEAAFKSFQKTLPPTRADHPYYDIIEFFQESDEGRQLCERWGLSFALHPDDKLWDSSLKDSPYFFKDPGNAVSVIPYKRIRPMPTELTSEQRAFLEEWYKDSSPFNLHLRDGRYIQIEIDLFANMGQIEAEITDKVQRYQNLIIEKQTIQESQNQEGPPPPSADLSVGQWIAERQKQMEQKLTEGRKRVERDFTYRRRGLSRDIYLDEEPVIGPKTIFQVWDMNKEGKSAWSITKELYPEIRGKSPNDYSDKFDKRAKQLLRNIERAIKAADYHIKSITPR